MGTLLPRTKKNTKIDTRHARLRKQGRQHKADDHTAGILQWLFWTNHNMQLDILRPHHFTKNPKAQVGNKRCSLSSEIFCAENSSEDVVIIVARRTALWTRWMISCNIESHKMSPLSSTYTSPIIAVIIYRILENKRETSHSPKIVYYSIDINIYHHLMPAFSWT